MSSSTVHAEENSTSKSKGGYIKEMPGMDTPVVHRLQVARKLTQIQLRRHIGIIGLLSEWFDENPRGGATSNVAVELAWKFQI